jgi:sulfofructose kinase
MPSDVSQSSETSRIPVDVLVAGLSVVDVLVRLPNRVGRGDKHEIRDLIIQGGAPAGNAACVLASLGWRTGFIGRLGANTLSTIARAEFTRHGVAEDFFIDDPLASPAVAVVEIDPNCGERTVFYSLSNYHHLEAVDIPFGEVRKARLILVDGYETDAALTMLEAASGSACRSVVDVEAGEPATLRRIISLATDAILPLKAGQRLAGRQDPVAVLACLCEWTAAQVIVTDGERGSWGATPNGVLHQPAIRVDTVDTTGCGDAYHGAYASALLDEFPLSLRMQFAAWVASQVAQHVGGRSGLPTRDSIRADSSGSISPELRRCLDAAPRWRY